MARLTLVNIYEDNSGRIYLHAEGAKHIYEHTQCFADKVGWGIVDEANFVALYLDEDTDWMPSGWPKKYVHKMVAPEPHWHLIATYTDDPAGHTNGSITIHPEASIGTAGRTLLGLSEEVRA